MDVRSMECFLRVSEEGSISRAASRLRMSQPPLTVRLQALEREMGVKLLVRHGRGVDLTTAGRVLADRCRRLLTDMELVTEEVRGVGLGTHGKLTIAVGPSVAPSFLSQLLTGLGADVDLRLMHLGDTDVVEAVHARDAEAGLLHLQPAAPGATRHAAGRTRGLEVAVVAREPLIVIQREDFYDRPIPERIDLANIASDVMAVDESVGPGLAAHVTSILETLRDAPKPRHQAGTAIQLLSLVASGAGVAILPSQFASLQWPGLVGRPLLQHTTVETGVLWRPHEDAPVLNRFLRVAMATPEPDVLGPAHARPNRMASRRGRI
jgi:DNA-binding transcriptional LysR family regulator